MTTKGREPLDVAAITEFVGQAQGKRYWRCLETLIQDDAFQERAIREFPEGVLERPASTRREFFSLMGASLALAGLAGCSAPREEIIPYVDSPEQIVPGKPLFFATAMTLGGVATGLFVEQHLGRPIKIEGNPDHPASFGATDAFAQAAVLTLYDPDRSAVVVHEGKPSSWPAAVAAWQEIAERLQRRNGAGLRVVTESITSPTLAHQIERLLEDFPEAHWHQYEPVSRGGAREGARQAFGADLDVVYHPEKADIVLALDTDFLGSGPGHLRYAREFMNRRRAWQADSPRQAQMNRLYAVGPTPTSTSAIADHHLSIRAGEVALFARAIASRLGVLPEAAGAELFERFPEDLLAELVNDLRNHQDRSLVIAGDHQAAEVHALAHAINSELGNVGRAVTYIPPVHVRPGSDTADEMQSLDELTRALERGEVEALIILGANPVFSAPADLEFARHLPQAPFRLHLGLYHDETASLCPWHIPESHFLESWGDARAYDGTVSLVQPLIAPLHNGVSALQLISMLRGRSEQSDYDLVREFWGGQWRDHNVDFEQHWRKAVHDGVVEGTAFSPVEVQLQDGWWNRRLDAPADEADSFEVVFRPDPTIYDGRFANNAWLQELPKPLTKTTWDNVVVFAPEAAREAGLELKIGDDGGDIVTDVVELTYQGRSIEAPAWILPGHAENSVTVYFGYGRSSAGRVGDGQGFNAYRLRSSDRPWFDSGLQVRKTGRRYKVATTQLHHVMHGRDIVRSGTLEQYRRHPHAPAEPKHKKRRATSMTLPIIDQAESAESGSEKESLPDSLYPEYSYPRYKWGMMIDQTACLGCNACVIACQAENNVPVVGKDEVLRGREMHWLRVDAYYHGKNTSRPDATYFQPIPCMHCEKAPCEIVCPVNATVHSDEGLNDMIYNRCVGTRYCSNNCPYKVRRFNYLEYADWTTESLKPLRNPDVTVRSRGVMEKCTYCVQRINAARIYAEKDDRPLKKNLAGEWVKPIYEHELMTACQAACPTQAIVFGDLNDPGSEVTKMRHQPLEYGLLAEELGTQPRTRYLAALRNPNPQVKSR